MAPSTVTKLSAFCLVGPQMDLDGFLHYSYYGITARVLVSPHYHLKVDYCIVLQGCVRLSLLSCAYFTKSSLYTSLPSTVPSSHPLQFKKIQLLFVGWPTPEVEESLGIDRATHTYDCSEQARSACACDQCKVGNLALIDNDFF